MSCIATACQAPDCAPFFIVSAPVFETMLTVEDGSIVAGANTYADSAAVLNYSSRYGATWTGTDLVKEQAIFRAMVYIEAFEECFAGQRVSTSQELAWPRKYVPNTDGTAYLSSTAIPAGVVNALSEAAVAELATPNVFSGARDQVDQDITSIAEKVGPLSRTVQYAAGVSSSEVINTRIMAFLEPYFGASGASGYLARGH